MRVANAAPLHLSNREVLTHFVAQKAETDVVSRRIANRRARHRAQMLDKYPRSEKELSFLSEEEKVPPVSEPVSPEEERLEDEAERRGVAPEVTWIQNQVLKYLCDPTHATSRQTEQGVAALADELQDYQLTKGEVLQLINLAPWNSVGLYCIIDELESRPILNEEERREEIIAHIQGTLLPEPDPELAQYAAVPDGNDGEYAGDEAMGDDDAEMMHAATAEQEYVYEAEWGKDKEDAVDDEPSGDMD